MSTLTISTTTGKTFKPGDSQLLLTSGGGSNFLGLGFPLSISVAGNTFVATALNGDLLTLQPGHASIATIASGSTVSAAVSGALGPPTSITTTALLDGSFGSAQGSLLYRSSTAWTTLAPGTNGQFLESGGASGNPSWGAPSGSGTVTNVTGVAASGFTWSIATSTSTPALTLIPGQITPTGVTVGGFTTAGGILYASSAGVFAQAASATIDANGDFNLPAVAAPGSPVAGALWNDSTQNCITGFFDGMTGYHPRLIYQQKARVAVSAIAANSLIVGNTTGAIGTNSLPAGYLNRIGRVVRLKILGFGTTPSSGQGTAILTLKLGTNVVGTTQAVVPVASLTNIWWEATIDIVCRTTGSSGTIDCMGKVLSLGTNLWSTALQFWVNGTAAGTTTTTAITLDLTAAYVVDSQITFTAATNTFTIVGVSLEAWG